MSDVQMGDFVVTSQNEDVGAVRASLADPVPEPAPETPEAPEAPEAPETPETPEEPETPAAAARPRDDKGQFAAKPGRKQSLQDRLNHATWEREEARREAARLSAEVEALRRGSPAPAAPSATAPSPVAAPSEGKPELADFDTHEEWADALVSWHMQQRDARDAAVVAERRQTDLRRSYAEREESYAATEPRFREAMASVATVQISPVLQHAILGSERGPALAFYLATHPEDATGIIGQTWNLPIEAAPLVRQLLEMKLPSPAPTGSGNGSRHVVPPPISPVGASPIVADPTPIDDLPVDQYIEAANARELAARVKLSTLRR